ncbi:MAG: arylformamidase [Alphaproteobacteria bacterium]|nr:arylformamidase [Alphaproteobacteria bacterium]
MNKRIWDISPTIQVGIPVWPGDVAYSEATTFSLSEDCPVNVRSFTMSAHTGAHADAPFHYDNTGKKAAEMDLTRYLGRCQVIDMRKVTHQVVKDDFVGRVLNGTERVLIRCYEQAPQDSWDADFPSVHHRAIAYLASLGVKLIGLDTPSLDPQNSKTLDAHHEVRRHNMSILEGLILDDVAEGSYELLALPLKFASLDASPVRAILREL